MFRDEGRFACALAALRRRDFAGAEAAFSDLLASDSQSASERAFLLNKRGVARIALEQREAAREDFNAALAALSRYAPALTNLGNLLLEEGDVDGAIARYDSAIAADPDYAIAHLNVSVAYKRAGRLADAVAALRASQRLERRANAASSWRPARRW